MIVLDDHGFPVQHKPAEAPNFIYKDGGDSSARSGILSLEYPEHKKNLPLFIKDGGLVRHPYQTDLVNKYAANDPRGISRDSVVQYTVGVDDTMPEAQAVLLNYAEEGRINQDFLGSDVRLYLYKAAGKEPPYKLANQGKKWMYISMTWNTEMEPDKEMNPFACMCIRLGNPWAKELVEYHPNIAANIRSYWSGWRDQSEIGEILIKHLYKAAYG